MLVVDVEVETEEEDDSDQEGHKCEEDQLCEQTRLLKLDSKLVLLF